MTEQTVTVTVPFAIRKRGGRKLVLTPDGTTAAPITRARVDSTLLKALARGFRWRKLLETGTRLGRATEPGLKIGICGEHGGDPQSVRFCHHYRPGIYDPPPALPADRPTFGHRDVTA